MTKYNLFIEKAVYKQLKNIPERDYQKIIASISALSNNPRPTGCIKLKGRPGYRIREGNYRVIYQINDKILIVTVIEAGDRKEIYDSDNHASSLPPIVSSRTFDQFKV